MYIKCPQLNNFCLRIEKFDFLPQVCFYSNISYVILRKCIILTAVGSLSNIHSASQPSGLHPQICVFIFVSNYFEAQIDWPIFKSFLIPLIHIINRFWFYYTNAFHVIILQTFKIEAFLMLHKYSQIEYLIWLFKCNPNYTLGISVRLICLTLLRLVPKFIHVTNFTYESRNLGLL